MLITYKQRKHCFGYKPVKITPSVYMQAPFGLTEGADHLCQLSAAETQRQQSFKL